MQSLHCDTRSILCFSFSGDIKYECKCNAGWRGNSSAGFSDCPCQGKTSYAICILRVRMERKQLVDANMPCSDEDECTLGTDECDTNSQCKNVPGSYECDCKPGYWRVEGSTR